IERIRRIKTVERKLHRLFRLLDRKSLHRARRVEHKHELLCPDIFSRNAVGWLKNQCEVTTLVRAMRYQGILDRAACDIVTKHEVLVGDRRAFAESQARAVRISTLNINVMCF